MVTTTITVTVNGKKQTLDRPTPLLELLTSRGINTGTIAIGYNREVIHRDHWGEIVLREGDALDIVHMVGGG